MLEECQSAKEQMAAWRFPVIFLAFVLPLLMQWPACCDEFGCILFLCSGQCLTRYDVSSLTITLL
jgi:hypothetical protein